MPVIFHEAAQFTPEWLDAAQCVQGLLGEGIVTVVTASSPQSSFGSRLYRLAVD